MLHFNSDMLDLPQCDASLNREKDVKKEEKKNYEHLIESE